jgi:hypothetical protein
MRLPAVAIAAAFACGIALGLHPAITPHVSAKLWIGREVAWPALVRLEELARSRKIPIEHERKGKSFDWDGVTGEFLWPDTRSDNVALRRKTMTLSSPVALRQKNHPAAGRCGKIIEKRCASGK